MRKKPVLPRRFSEHALPANTVRWLGFTIYGRS